MEWVKKNKILSIIIFLVVGYWFVNRQQPLMLQKSISNATVDYGRSYGMDEGIYLESAAMGAPAMAPMADTTAVSNERMVVNTSSLSMVVTDVRESGQKVTQYAEDNGGFMVSSTYNRPEESPYATITVRVASDKFDEAMEYYRNLGVKVVHENLIGHDVTDQYTDIEKRLDTLNKAKIKLEQILDQATEIEDILRANRELLSLQSQIDSWVGQKQSIEDNVNLTKIMVYLSTDELSLPYAPDEQFRPNVIFKLAVRGLVRSLRSGVEWLIWIGVYSVIWVPVLVLVWVVRKYYKKPSVK